MIKYTLPYTKYLLFKYQSTKQTILNLFNLHRLDDRGPTPSAAAISGLHSACSIQIQNMQSVKCSADTKMSDGKYQHKQIIKDFF